MQEQPEVKRKEFAAKQRPAAGRIVTGKEAASAVICIPQKWIFFRILQPAWKRDGEINES